MFFYQDFIASLFHHRGIQVLYLNIKLKTEVLLFFFVLFLHKNRWTHFVSINLKKKCHMSCSDFGYYRPENRSECVEQEELKGRPLEFCLNGTTEQLQTSGWGSLFSSWIFPRLQFRRQETQIYTKYISMIMWVTSLQLWVIGSPIHLTSRSQKPNAYY